jgi:hypothetical protein
MPAPLLDDDARLLQRVEDLPVEQFVMHAGTTDAAVMTSSPFSASSSVLDAAHNNT